MSFAVIQVSTGVVYGIGDSVAGAVADASEWCDRDAMRELAEAPILDDARTIRDLSEGFAIAPAHPTFCDAVSRRGGDIPWTTWKGKISDLCA